MFQADPLRVFVRGGTANDPCYAGGANADEDVGRAAMADEAMLGT